MSAVPEVAHLHRASTRLSSREAGVLVAACLGAMVTFFLITASVSSLGAIGADLAVAPASLVWVPSSYTLVVASLILTAGSAGDRWGRRRAFVCGTLVLAAAAVLVLSTRTFGALLAGELLAGVGGALVLPNSLSIVSLTFADPHRRTEAITTWVASSGLGLAVGPLAAGWVLLHHDWRLTFVPVIVLSLLATGLALSLVTDSRHPDAELDFAGAVLGTVAIGGFVYGLVGGGQHGYDDPRSLTAFAAAAVAAAVFVDVERRVRRPMLDVRLLANPAFAAVMVVAGVALFGFTGLAITLVLHFESDLGLDALATGWRLLPLFLAYVVVAMAAGRLVRRAGFRVPLVAGLVLVAAASLGLASQVDAAGYLRVWPALIAIGAGIALVAAPSTAAAIAGVRPEEAGMAASAVNAARQVGSVMGSSFVGSVVVAHGVQLGVEVVAGVFAASAVLAALLVPAKQ
ncbi:MFS transporter [Solicola sp. PLA-1-18]|uniref:MFS transporter n=1 Tax=Solicola sp. PLA-1-18 TaxID=3380532 RepID=UPI003B81DD93